MFNKIGILGLGLIGGSLARALKKYSYPCEIYGYNRNKASLEDALSSGSIDVAVEDFSQFSDCDLIVLCCPVNVNLLMFNELIPFLKDTVVITDVGSTKEDIHRGIHRVFHPGYFIGGHPMAGSEKSGFSATSAELFENAYYILTPEEGTPSIFVDEMKQLIETIHAIWYVLDPKQHDSIVAAISHVPHILASSLVNMVENLDSSNKEMFTLAAGGFKDFTRIASSSPEMWQQICLANQEAVLSTLDTYIHMLNQVRQSLLKNDEDFVFDLFAQSKKYRNSFQNKVRGSIEKTYALFINIADEPGIIGLIATDLGSNKISIKNIGINNNREDFEGVLEIIFSDAASLEKGRDVLKDIGYTIIEN
jgi:prephenate dehydrogenase